MAFLFDLLVGLPILVGETVALSLLEPSTQPTSAQRESPKNPKPLPENAWESVPSPTTRGGARASPPSLLVKAYMIALKSKLTPEPSLDDVDQAIFVALPPEKGVINDVADEYLNEMVYQLANATQKEDSIAFTHSGNFFQYMNDFVAQNHTGEAGGLGNDASNRGAAGEAESPSPELKAYLAARARADDEFAKLLEGFKAAQKNDRSYQFQQYLANYGDGYKKAWDARDEAASKLEPTDLVRSMQIFDSAQSRAKSLHGQNMRSTLKPVSAKDPDRRKLVTDDDVFYRPLHTLFGYKDGVSNWHIQYLDKITDPSEIELDLVQALDTRWANLGFPAFDNHSTPGIDTAGLQDLVDKGLKVTLTYTHMEPFRVIRGLWNIEDFREVLGAPVANAKPELKCKIYKTTRLLFAYGRQIKVKGPEEVFRAISHQFSEVSLVKLSENERGTDKPENDEYPVLLAVLADRC